MAVFVGGAASVYDDGVAYVNYIQSTGTQHINTGYYPNQDTKVVMDVQSEMTTHHALISARSSANANTLEVQWHTSGYYRFQYNNGYSNVTVPGSVTDRRTITVDKNVITIGDVSVSRTYVEYQATVPLLLFARNQDGQIYIPAKAKLFSCKIYDNDRLVRDYRPCIDPSGVACLYDKCNREYVYNAGSGVFIAG